MRRLIPYVVGVAAVAGAEYLYAYYQFGGSLRDGHPSGWTIVFLFYFAGASGAVGGLIGLVVAARCEPRAGWGLALAQGIIAVLVPVPVVGLALDLNSLPAAIAVWALAGAAGALLSFGLYIAVRVLVRWGNPSHRL